MTMATTNERRAQKLDERINKLENEYGSTGADMGRRELIAQLTAERVTLRPTRLTPYDLRLVQQIEVNRKPEWYYRAGRLYRPYHGKKDRVFWKDGRLQVQWWGHSDADPIAQARSFATGDGSVLPPVLHRHDSDYASLREWLEEVYGPPSLFKLPWEDPCVYYRGFEISVCRDVSLGGDELLYFYVMRQRDGRFMEDNFEDSAEKVEDMVGYMKERIDAFLALPLKERRKPDENF